MRFLDADVILRFLTRDVRAKAERCLFLLQQADLGEIELYTSEVVIAEVVQVLSSPRLYNLPRERIRALLLPIIDLRGLRLFPSRAFYQHALRLYAEREIDFRHALAAAHVAHHRLDAIVSYDAHLDVLPGVTRIEP
jgi:predicted nucleic acid-binding protein